MSALSLLNQLYESMPGTTSGERWATLAERLNRLADRKWSGTYVQSSASGRPAPTPSMAAAAQQLAAQLDDKPGFLATAVAIEVYADPQTAAGMSGAYIMGSPRLCERCGAKFVPSVPWRRFCPSCRPARV